MESSRVHGPLAGVKVVEVAGIAAAPYGVMMLADMGAEVIRVDRVAEGTPVRDPRGDVLNRGRRSIALDLKSEAGAAVVRRLAREADVFVEAFRPGVMERLGLGPQELLQDNPRLVYARMTGWGQDGPWAQRAGHDINFIGLTGTLHALGSRDAPPSPPLNLVGDFGGGGLLLAFGIVCAVLEARNSGRGQVVDAAMVDGAASLTSLFYALTQAGHWRDERGSNRLDGAAPHYGAYETADGKYMAVGALEPKFYALLLQGLGIPPGSLPDVNERRHWPALRERFAQAFRGRSRADWEQVFERIDACVTPVYSLSEAGKAAQLASRGTVLEAAGVAQAAPAPRLDRTPGCIGLAPPHPGEHSKQILAELGLDASEREQLLASGVVVQRGPD
jgi:alpha-methylacyl-CoA racemase